MGIIISRFRKKKTTADKLRDIEEKIKGIEKFQKETEQQFRKVVTKLVISSILVYIGAIVVYYYYFTPGTFKEHFFNFLPLIVFPIAIYFSRKMLSWYFERKLKKNEINLKNLKATKKQILEEVMDKETYKVAKEILEKYAPEQLNKDVAKPMNMNIKAVSPVTSRSDMTLRHRNVDPPTKRFNGSAPLPDVAFQAVPKPSSHLQPKLPLPRPVFPPNRGAFDKLIDMVIGDGPGSRYALICRMCSSHNGMALKHEFEYLAFRCAYCLQWNPARKQKPQAPNLVSESGSQDESDANNSEIEKINGDSKSQNDCDVKAITAGEDTENQNQSNDSAQCSETEINPNSEKPSTEAIPDILSTSDITELQKPVDEPTADSPSEFRTKDNAIEEHSQIDSNTSTNTETDER